MRLEDVGSFSKGAGISRSEASSGRIPAVRYGEIYTDHDNYIKRFRSFISSEIAKQSRRMKKGCLLFAASGETKEDIGKAVAFIDDFEAYAGGDLIILNPKGDIVSLYLGYTLNSPVTVRQRAMQAQGDSVVHISTGAIQNIAIPLPPKPEQERIAAALTSIDSLIDNLERTIQKKKHIREGAMEELLSGKRRLPGFSGEWIEKKIGEIGYMVRGVSYKPYQSFYLRTPQTTPLLRSNNIQDGKMVFTDVVYVMDMCIGKSQYMEQGDLLICTANGSKSLVGKSALYYSSITHTFGAFMGVLRCKDVRYAPFIYYVFQTLAYRHQIEDILAGSAINNLNAFEIEGLSFGIPADANEIFAIADTLTALDDEIALLQAERDKYQQIRSGMMDDLLTGKIRLQ